MGERAILHVDMNSCYASIEQAERPELRGKPVVVGGDEEARHGIVLTKSAEAKRFGVKTAETLWQARRKCPGLVVVPPRYALYQRYSRMAREVYYSYTPLVEDFGLDEAWLDLTGCPCLDSKTPLEVAHEVRERVKRELGVTVSVGVSWNKVFAKWGSDHKKPDAVTEVTRENFRSLVWPDPVDELIYVGPATKRKLHDRGVRTIGELAHAGDYYLRRRFGKVGFMLRSFARGEDASPVAPYDPELRAVAREVKSLGNGLTAPRPLAEERDVKALCWLLAESVAQRLREAAFRCRVVSVGARFEDFSGFQRQERLFEPTCSTQHVARAAWRLLREAREGLPGRPVRALHVRASALSPLDAPVQGSLWESDAAKLEELDFAIDGLRSRFGNLAVRRGIAAADPSLSGLDVKAENTVHPVGLLQGRL